MKAHAEHGEVDRQHVALLAAGIIAGGAVDAVDVAVGEGRLVEVGGFLGLPVEPQAGGELAGHVSPRS